MFAHIHSHTQATGECLKRGRGDERERVRRVRGWEISALEGGKDKDR